MRDVVPKAPESTNVLMLRDEVRKKADERIVNTQIAALKDDVNAVTKAVDGWKNLKIGGVVSVVVIVIAGIGQYFALEDSVEDNQDEISEIQEDVAQVKSDVQAVKVIVEEDQKHRSKTDRAQIEAIRDAVKDALDTSGKIRGRKNR